MFHLDGGVLADRFHISTRFRAALLDFQSDSAVRMLLAQSRTGNSISAGKNKLLVK